MKKILNKVLIFSITAAIIAGMVLLMIHLTPKPPVKEMEHAQQCLSEALRNGAETYAGKLYREAVSSYDSAMANWKRQNKRFLFVRDYDKVIEYASLSAEKAIQASSASVSNTETLRARIREKIDSLHATVQELDNLFGAYPLESETRNRISKGKMLLKEAEITFSKGGYLQANRKIIESGYLLTSSYETASENLKNYFKSFSQWKSWTDKAIKDSRRNGNYSIIIDKFSRKLIIYQKGIKKMEFNAELGRNWVGDKRIKGDHATPEGMYRITKKFGNGKTKYYKALLLDYPNEEDKAKFKAEVASGVLPRSAKIGGLIEIHGNGGKGIDWTEGCIALTDHEMDAVYNIAIVGTPVTIVGSTVNLHEILNK